MKTKEEILKNRSEIKRLEILIKKEIDWNFGQCPNNRPHFDQLMDQHKSLWNEISATDKEWFQSVLLDWDYKVDNGETTWEKLPIE